jgi:hypothetical protein
MTKNLDIISAAVSLIIKATLLAARFSGRVRKRSLKRLAAMNVDTKDKEIIFLRDKVDQLTMQVSILQKGIKKRQKNPRYTLREKLFILWQMDISASTFKGRRFITGKIEGIKKEKQVV